MSEGSGSEAEIPAGATPSVASKLSTLGNLLNSEFFGMWRDRTDIPDSIDFARELRSEGWNR